MLGGAGYRGAISLVYLDKNDIVDIILFFNPIKDSGGVQPIFLIIAFYVVYSQYFQSK
jgi:hypothetical protein